jgi:CBS domain-containing protein
MIKMDLAQTWLPYSLDDSVIDVLPDIFERPFLFIYSNTKLVELATYLAIGPQIYADGMLVFQQQEEDDKKQQKVGGGAMINRRKVIGRISGKHIICHIIKSDFSPCPDHLYAKTASEIMDAITNNEIIKKDSSLRRVIEVFKETRFAFVPIIGTPLLKGNNFPNDNNEEAEEVTAALSIRDFLSLFTGAHRNNSNIDNNNIDTQEKICMPVKEISSNLVSVSQYDSIKDAIDIMINRGIRNIGIKNQNSDLVGVINDRNIIEFLLSPRWRLKEIIDSIEHSGETRNNESTQINIKEVIADSNHSNNNIGRVPSINSIINDLRIIPISEVKVEENTTISRAAELLMDIHNPFLVLQRENAIVTPWDIVMKTAGFSNK